MVEGSLLQNCWARPFRWSRFLTPPFPAARDPPVHSHYPAAVTTIIIFLLAQPRTVMAGQRSWKKFPPRSAKYTLCILLCIAGPGYRRYPRPLLGFALRANALYSRHNSQLFSIVRGGGGAYRHLWKRVDRASTFSFWFLLFSIFRYFKRNDWFLIEIL